MTNPPKLNLSKLFLKKMGLPIILFSVLIFPLFFGQYIPIEIKSFIYSISLAIKSLLVFVLPFIIFSFVFSAIMNLKSGAFKFILALVSMIYISNCAAILMGFSVGSLMLGQLAIPPHSPISPESELLPLWTIGIKPFIDNQYALISGFILGILLSFKKNPRTIAIAQNLNFYAHWFLKKIFIPVLPIFILGFVFKLEHEGMLGKALKTYAPVFLIVVGTQMSYVLWLYMIASKFSLPTFWRYIKNILPATITGFSTISSAATMPLLILCTEKNLPNPDVADMVIPATINTHTIGSAIGITILSLSTLLAFGHELPTFLEFFEFGMVYALAKFAVAAVPGGAIIVVTPLLETYLHFSTEMVGLVTAFYMLFDPFGTATNVTGNGFFPIAFSKLYKI
jgi:Na+/H+-dicarboxylate symporter